MTPALVLLSCLAGCSGSSSSPSSPSTPAPTPTPNPNGTIRFVSASLPAASTVPVSPMFGTGQQAQSLSFRAAVTLARNYDEAIARAYVRTENQVCLGAGQAHLSFRAGVELVVDPLSLSRTAADGLCTLPYTTTQVEIEVYDTVTQTQVVAQRFPMTYSFVAAP